jgi:hypothetical protein
MLLLKWFDYKSDVSAVLERISHALATPLNIAWTADTPKYLLIFTFVYIMGIGVCLV